MLTVSEGAQQSSGLSLRKQMNLYLCYLSNTQALDFCC